MAERGRDRSRSKLCTTEEVSDEDKAAVLMNDAPGLTVAEADAGRFTLRPRDRERDLDRDRDRACV